jgi:hypothetical protein
MEAHTKSDTIIFINFSSITLKHVLRRVLKIKQFNSKYEYRLGNTVMSDVCMTPPEDDPKHRSKHVADIK